MNEDKRQVLVRDALRGITASKPDSDQFGVFVMQTLLVDE
jgi:hypothetical protein